ncbi:MAG: hypothetical protein WC451_03070 [Patescibacteria group bacterium]|jgi:hypothetical protein
MCSPPDNLLPDCSAEVRAFVQARLDKDEEEMIADVTEDQYVAWYNNVYDSPDLLKFAPSLTKWKGFQDNWMIGLHRSLRKSNR